ncbi:MAG: Eco57I restriction-modification methylase domain-containing protein [Candidatus Lokiarchaeota archaeon]|nr:Eco57I restriction-modification methylase domain-containing protein [Candidatus Lokiarchaeota archaeon]
MVSNKNNFHRNNSIGQIFTPNYVAEFMVRNIATLVLESKMNLQRLKVLEPSAGEGIFLKHFLQNKFSNIHAYEMDLSLKENLLDLFPTVKLEFKNFLDSSIADKYDIIIGNPPYLGQNYNAAVFQEYVRKYPICEKFFVGNMDLFYYFIHMGIEKLNPGGFLSFITTNYWITKSQKTGIKYLKPHILNECFLVQYIDLSNLKIFEDARGQHNCIFVLQKKSSQEKINKTNKDIQIIQTLGKNEGQHKQDSLNNLIFQDLIHNNHSSSIRKYTSATTNEDLELDSSWNLLYSKDVKVVVDKIENYCKDNGNISKLNDLFIIRNGLILINDSVFILKEGKELKFENNQLYIQIKGEYFKLNEFERNRLKKAYKSKSIIPYGYLNEDYAGYILYFNKNEFGNQSENKRNHLLEKKYPSLTKYLKQFEDELRETLINAKENPHDLYYPRRGSFIRKTERDSKEILVDLEPLYEQNQKIFFKYISTKNIFGFTADPYYATSDTYFLWPKSCEKSINYPFILAYLNSSIVSFLYKAKNIIIKRSKTKLEYGLPIPNIKNFITEEKSKIINLIENLVVSLIGDINSNPSKKAYNDKHNIQRTIDSLFFQLFDLDVKNISKLLEN